jgi:hypothetical protein
MNNIPTNSDVVRIVSRIHHHEAQNKCQRLLEPTSFFIEKQLILVKN